MPRGNWSQKMGTSRNRTALNFTSALDTWAYFFVLYSLYLRRKCVARHSIVSIKPCKSFLIRRLPKKDKVCFIILSSQILNESIS